jgi:Heavy metal binding domain
MRRPRLLGILLAISLASACDRAGRRDAPTTTPAVQAAAPKLSTDLAYVCPMDRDIRSNEPGKCSRCGMELVAGIPDQTEYHLDLTVTPTPAKPGDRVRLTFEVFDPWKDQPRPSVLRARSSNVGER